MKELLRLAWLPLVFLVACKTRPSGSETPAPEIDALVEPASMLERRAGWCSLFDGRTTRGWRAFGGTAFPAQGWRVEDGCLRRVAGVGGGDLVSVETYGDFELELEWKVVARGNSGIKIRIDEAAGAIGPEYQILDDAAHPDGRSPDRTAGALYDVIAPSKSRPVAANEFHHARIVARGNHIEHWIDGERVVDVEVDSEAWRSAVSDSKFDAATFGRRSRGRILLQDHGTDVWFKNIKLRDLEHLPGREVELFDGTHLDAWISLGDALYTANENSILGMVGGGGQSFLRTRETFGDFLFEVEVKIEGPGNSGIQVRSNQQDNGRVFGYQIEIDPSARAWSGGLYDEARRGWLHDLSQNPAGRAALDLGGWNRYRIECVGPWVRAWVNGIPTADRMDPLTQQGFIALQVHSGTGTRVRWKNLRLRDLGHWEWREQQPEPPESRQWKLDPGEQLVRVSFDSLEWGMGERVGASVPEFEPLGAGFKWSPNESRFEFSPRYLAAVGLDAGTHRLTFSTFQNRLVWHLDGRFQGRTSLEGALPRWRVGPAEEVQKVEVLVPVTRNRANAVE